MMLYNQYLVSEQEALSLEDLICFEETVLVETRSGKFVCASFGVILWYMFDARERWI